MKRRFDKARAYHRRVFVRFLHPHGFTVYRTIFWLDGVKWFREHTA